MTTVGVITTCHSYERFLLQWAASVAGLNRQPDQIVVAFTNPDQPAVDALATDLGPRFSAVQAPRPWVFADSLNTAIAACHTDWIVWIGADDVFHPWALDGWEESAADVVCFGLEFPDGSWSRVVVPPTAGDILQLTGNLIPCGSPFRRHVWERVPFQPAMTPLEDLAFGVGAALLGCVFASTGRVDFVYRVHAGQMRPDEGPVYQRIRDWADGWSVDA